MSRAVNSRLWVVEFLTAPILLVTVVFSFLHQEYGTAVIVGICTGLVAGIQLGATLVRRTFVE